LLNTEILWKEFVKKAMVYIFIVEKRLIYENFNSHLILFRYLGST
jgi:hypothetical protein